MTITAKSVLASVSPDGKRIDTLLLRYPRFIHAEFMTHRQFSRNASSSRAIPVARLIEDIEADAAYPSFWGKNRPGMQAEEELTGAELMAAMDKWEQALQNAITTARALSEIGAHKQIVNRILEPFAHINVVVTATEWENFFDLRIHDDAQPEIKALAEAMRGAIDGAETQILSYGEWHLPFVNSDEIAEYGGLTDPSGNLRVVSAARCARTSYKTHDGRVSSLEEDITLGERLTKSRPFHASPFEHPATPDILITVNPGNRTEWFEPGNHRNFTGWMQSRAFMETHT